MQVWAMKTPLYCSFRAPFYYCSSRQQLRILFPAFFHFFHRQIKILFQRLDNKKINGIHGSQWIVTGDPVLYGKNRAWRIGRLQEQ